MDPADRSIKIRCVAIIDAALPCGKAANAAAVLALTMGQRQPQLVGEALVDRDGHAHPGLIPIGIPVLGASQGQLAEVWKQAKIAGLEMVDFPVQGQSTTNYRLFQQDVSKQHTGELRYLGLMLVGEAALVRKLTRRLRPL